MKKTIAEPASKAEILERFKKLTADSQRQWGTMNAHQMVCHLCDSQLLVMGEIPTTSKSNVLGRTLIKHIALRAPMKWPPGVKTVPELDQAAGAGTAPAVFEKDRARMFELIDRYTASKRDFEFVPHPIFGAMSDWEWMRWAYLHADHHLRQFGL